MVADSARNATVETAYGEGNKTYYQAVAEASTVSEVIKAQSGAYKEMMTNLSFANTDIISYMKNNLIKDYSEGKIVMQLDL